MAAKRNIRVSKKVGVSGLGKGNMVPEHGHGSTLKGGQNSQKTKNTIGVEPGRKSS